VGDRDDGALVLLQVLLQPRHGLGVEVVGRLVEEQDVGLGQQQPAQRHAAAFTAGEHLHRRVAGRAAQCVHGQLEVGFVIPPVVLVELLLQTRLFRQQRIEVGVGFAKLGADLIEGAPHLDDGRNGLLDHLHHGLFRVELGLLFEQPTRVALAEHGLADIGVVDAGHDAEQGALAGPVEAEHADLGAVVKAERDVAQHLFLGRVDAPDAHHRIDDFLGFCHGEKRF